MRRVDWEAWIFVVAVFSMGAVAGWLARTGYLDFVSYQLGYADGLGRCTALADVIREQTTKETE